MDTVNAVGTRTYGEESGFEKLLVGTWLAVRLPCNWVRGSPSSSGSEPERTGPQLVADTTMIAETILSRIIFSWNRPNTELSWWTSLTMKQDAGKRADYFF